MEISTTGGKSPGEKAFQGKNYDRPAGIGRVLDGFILSKTDVSFKERGNLIIIAVNGSDS